MRCERRRLTPQDSFGLAFCPVDAVKDQSAAEHFSFKIRGVFFPLVRLSNAKPGLLAEADKLIVSLQSPRGRPHTS
jgi:hypothetical protein